MLENNLPRYFEDEVKVFHPFFEKCALEAIKNLPKNNLIVSHHKNINGIIVDYAIEDIISKKIVLLVEIKRTKSSLISTRNRYQALSYRKEADLQCATPYYLLTNLEKTEVFRYESNIPRVNNQLIKDSPFEVGDLENDEYDYFFNKFVKILERIIDIVIEDKGEYGYNLDSLYNLLSASLFDYGEWHSVLMPFLFEYIRGASKNYSELCKKINSWKSADSYIKNPEIISIKGSKVDFQHVFKEPIPSKNSAKLFDSFLLNNAFNIGQRSGKGEEIKELVSDLLFSEFKGVVETDPELADLLSVLARNELGRSLRKDELICDPAAGGGQLLSSAASLAFKNIEPHSIFANEIRPFFSEILSLRLGLLFANKISLENSPKITIDNIADLNKNDFINTKVILLNPPFINSIESEKEKNYIQNKIKNLKHICITESGQIGLEASFLELVTSLAEENSIIGAIMPLNLLTRKGDAIKRFRQYLLDDFGLSMICTYPREGLFKDVKKRTCILIGRIGNKNKPVKWIEINTSIERLNFKEMLSSIDDSNRIYLTNLFSNNSLREGIDIGWNIKQTKISREWFLSIFSSKTISINEIFNIKRGTSGNSGSSDLCAIPLTKKYKLLRDLIPKFKQIPAINRSENLEKLLDASNAKWISPELNGEEDIFLNELIHTYIKFKKDNKKKGKQTKAPINIKKIKNDLKTIHIFPKWSVLIPRSKRTYGSISILNEPYNISSNFFVVNCKNKKEAITVASWLFSIFGQLQMEYLCSDQEGTRKLEVTEIKKQLFMPFICKNISDKNFMSFEKLFDEELPLEFKNIKIRKIDKAWAKLLFENHDEILRKSFEIMQDLIEERSP